MPEITKYLEEAASDQHLGSYYQVAKDLGVMPSYIYKCRDFGGLTDKHCIKLATILGENPLVLIAAKNTDLAKDSKVKAFWKGTLKRIMNFEGFDVGTADDLIPGDPYYETDHPDGSLYYRK